MRTMTRMPMRTMMTMSWLVSARLVLGLRIGLCCGLLSIGLELGDVEMMRRDGPMRLNSMVTLTVLLPAMNRSGALEIPILYPSLSEREIFTLKYRLLTFLLV